MARPLVIALLLATFALVASAGALGIDPVAHPSQPGAPLDAGTVSLETVPTPQTALLLLSGLVGLAHCGRRV